MEDRPPSVQRQKGGFTPATPVTGAAPRFTPGFDVEIKGKKPLRHREGAGRVLMFCLAQFIRRYCSGSRQRLDQYRAYLEVNITKNSPRVLFDLQVAQLVVRVLRATNDARGP